MEDCRMKNHQKILKRIAKLGLLMMLGASMSSLRQQHQLEDSLTLELRK